MKHTIKVPPSSTEQTIVIDIAEPIIQTEISGTTPIVIPPPAEEPPAEPTDGYKLVYETGYDEDSDIRNANNQLGQGSISTTVKKSGRGSFRAFVNSNAKSNVSSGWRSEVQYGSNWSRDGEEIVLEYDTLFEKLPNLPSLSTQWHGGAEGTSGQLSLWIDSGKFNVVRSVEKGNNIYQPSSQRKAITLNKWYHMRWEVKFSPGRDGYVRLFIDDMEKPYYEATGKTSDGTGQWLKIGTNVFGKPSNEAILYVDNLKLWRKE